jgi:coproporphyrinogen III oxidase-like Fe-S oxidoreductase
MNALRLNDGFSIAQYETRTGLAWSQRGAAFATAFSRGLLEQQDGQVRTTELGRRHLNGLLTLFLE